MRKIEKNRRCELHPELLLSHYRCGEMDSADIRASFHRRVPHELWSH